MKFHTHGPIFLGNFFIVLSFFLIGALWCSYLPAASRTLYAKFAASHAWLEPGAGLAAVPESFLRLLRVLCNGDLVRLVSGPAMLWVSWVWINYSLHIDDQLPWRCVFSRLAWGKLEDANTHAHVVAIAVLLAQCATIYYPFSQACALPDDAASLAAGTYNADNHSFKLLLCVRFFLPQGAPAPGGLSACRSPARAQPSRPTHASHAHPCRRPTSASLAPALQLSLRPTSEGAPADAHTENPTTTHTPRAGCAKPLVVMQNY